MPPFHAMDVMVSANRAEARGRDVIHMEVGEPGGGAPAAAREAVERAMRDGGGLGYTSGLGLPALRDGIAALYDRRYGVSVDPGRIVVTGGSSAGFVLSFLALFDPGARVATPEPGYPCYRNIMEALGLKPVGLLVGPETRYTPTVEHLDRAGPVDGMLIASPANPTGAVIGRDDLSALIGWAGERGAALISDEIYHGLTFDAPATTALSLTDEVFVLNSFSKFHGMTGWRVGWMVVPERFVRTLQTLAQNLFICAPHVSQEAALGALSEAGEAECAARLAAYRENRDVVLPALASLGFRDVAPAGGAFYAYARLPEGWDDSQAFCAELLVRAGVAATPGLDFDPGRGQGTVRFSFAGPTERMREGMERLAQFLGGQPKVAAAAR